MSLSLPTSYDDASLIFSFSMSLRNKPSFNFRSTTQKSRRCIETPPYMTWQGSTLPYCKNMTEVGHTKPKGFFFSSQLWKLKSMVPEPASSQGTWSSQHRQLWWPACPAVEVQAEKSHEVPAKSKMELLCFVMILSQDAQSRSMSTRAHSLGTAHIP